MKAVLLGSEPMENKPEETLLIPHEKLSIFYEWLENHDKQVKTEVIDEIINRLCFSEIISYKSNDIKRILEQLKEQTNGI